MSFFLYLAAAAGHSFGGYGKISGKCLVLRDSEKTVSLGAFVGLLNRRGFIGN